MSNLGLLITSILSSGVVSAIISSILIDRRERWALRREKVEEIFICSANWLKEVGISLMPFLNVCAGKISYNDALDMQIADKEKAHSIGEYHLKMQMNIKMYEPTLIPSLENVETSQKNINKIFNAIRSCYNETGQASEFEEIYRNALLDFSNAGNKLEMAIIERGREVGSERGIISDVVLKTKDRIISSYCKIKKNMKIYKR